MQAVVKRNGEKQAFNAEKIIKAVEAAFNDVENEVSTSAHALAQSIATIISQIPNETSVEDIQDKVEELLMASHRKDVARAYIQWRFKRSLVRRENTTDKDILSLIEGKNNYWNDENANKNAMVAHTMRDYLAGIVSTDISRRLLIPEDVVQAHDEGIIHFHDADYFVQPIHNCSLINIEDMLQNGTVINGVKIDKPHRLITAATIVSQIVAFVGSSQYGGCTFSLAHLAPFVEESRKRFRSRFEKIVQNKDELERLIEEETNKEIIDATQTIFFQLNSLNSSNGQAPFVSICMYLNEVPDGQIKEDLAKLIAEMMNQRIQGFKNEQGVWVTPAFPKLLYFLEEDNIRPGAKYWYLTELAAKSSAKRMAPDYISEKIMKQLKHGESYPCMGAVKGDSVICTRANGSTNSGGHVQTFEQFWLECMDLFDVKIQPGRKFDLYANVTGVQIKDTRHKWVNVKKIMRVMPDKWYRIMLGSGKVIICTYDHPFPVFDPSSTYEAPDKKYNVKGYRRVETKDLHIGDKLRGADVFEDVIVSIEQESVDAHGLYAYDVETESDTFEVNGVWSCNCRSFLTPDIMEENYAHAENFDTATVAGNSGHYYGRFNQGVVTINLPDVALSALASVDDFKENNKEEVMKMFWKIFDERLELCHKALMVRHERLLKTVSDNAPIMWQHGALARLKPGESIKELLYHGYSTISLGYAGLYECVKAITGQDQTEGEGKAFGLQVMQHMNDKANEWKKASDISFSVYGTPIESTTWKFAKALKRRFGDDVFIKLDGHDRQFITNSYHVPVWKHVTGFEKLAIESEFQKLSPGGAVSYIECPDLTKNIPAMLQIIQFIYDTIMYAEINTRSGCYCHECGFEGEIQMIDKENKLTWHCPVCGNEDQRKMTISLRICGYLGLANSFNQGRMNDIKDRVLHIDDMV